MHFFTLNLAFLRLVMSNLSFSHFSTIGFSGSRHLSGPAFAACRGLAASAVAAGCTVFTGCASGADRAAHLGAGSAAIVFSAYGPAAHQLVARSVSFVRALAAAPAPLLVSFPLVPCPAGLLPSSSPSRCFSGFGSGSWATLALAVGLGLPVRVFLPAAVVPPAAWGGWSLLSSGPFSGSWALSQPAQPSLF